MSTGLDVELERIANSVAAGTGAVRVLTAPRARGRTTALRRLAEMARARVLSATCTPDESETPFALLHQLSGHTGIEEFDDVATTRHRFWRFLVAAGPVLLLVDDVHWADEESARVLAYAGRRVGGRSLGLVCTAAAEWPLRAELATLPSTTVPGSSDGDARELLGDVPAHVVHGLLELCERNPLVLRETAAELSLEQLSGRVPLPAEPVIGPRGARAFAPDVPDRTRDWLLLLALGPALPVCLRAARPLELQPDDLAPAERAGIVRTAPELIWRSGLERAAVRQRATLAETARTCAALAAATDPQQWPAEHAEHLAGSLTEPERAAAALARATVPMAQQGRVLDAYTAANRAVAGATDPAERERFRIIAAELAWLAGYVEHALDLLAVPIRHSSDAELSAAIMRAVIHGFTESWTTGWRLLPIGGGTEPGSSEHTLRLVVTALTAGWEVASPDSLRRAVGSLRERLGAATESVPGAVPALETVVSGHSDPGVGDRQALRTLAWWSRSSDAVHPKAWPPPLLPVFIGEEEHYAELFTHLMRGDHVRSAPSTRALLLLKLAVTKTALGQWDSAAQRAADSARLAEDLGHHALRCEALLAVAWINAGQGDERTCRSWLEEATSGPASPGAALTEQWIRGLLALSCGRGEEAWERLRALRRPAENPHHLLVQRMSTVDATEAAMLAGRTDEAAEVVRGFAAWVAAGAADWARLDLARCWALLGGDAADGAETGSGEDLLAIAARAGRPFATARTELQIGSALRRRKRHQDARAHLRSAEERFDRLGATAWSRRAHAELRATGDAHSRPELPDPLTPQERQIADLAAQGLTNRQIASTLALSPRTVGYHLYKIFPKLDITSRAQLGAALRRLPG